MTRLVFLRMYRFFCEIGTSQVFHLNLYDTRGIVPFPIISPTPVFRRKVPVT